MPIADLIAALSSPAAYPHPVADVHVCQTHISAVFLAGDFAYKIKKPVLLDFVDFSTLERRRHFCNEELRLNERLAPSVYRGVVPVTRIGERIQVEGTGDVVEWAVKMVRLSEEATLRQRLKEGTVDAELMRALARRVAGFHAAADRGEAISALARPEAVARNTRENLNYLGPPQAPLVSTAVHERLRALTEAALERLAPLMEARADRGLPRDTHGDLRLDHVYLFPERPPPDDLVVIDCVEFCERFRWADPVADMAFLVMDLLAVGRRDLAEVFADTWFEAACDAEGRQLLGFFTAYRAAVRAKVDGLKSAEAEVPEAERQAARVKARGHWLRALAALEEPARKPCLLLLAGLPGTGKSTLARALADRAGLMVLRSDVVRKEIAGGAADLYSPGWSEHTYAACLDRAAALLFEGRRVLIDANFRTEGQRGAFLDTAVRWGVPLGLLVCRAAPDIVRQRLARRGGDASDADWAVYQRLHGDWEEPNERWQPLLGTIDTGGDRDVSAAQALEALRRLGVYGPV